MGGGGGYFYPNKRINFVLPEALTNTPTILVDNLPVLIEDNILTAISLTTTRPTTITVNGQTQTIRLKRLKKQDVITINLIHKNKKKTYFLRTLPISFPHLYVEKQTSVIPSGYVLISFHGLKLQHPSYSVIMDMAGNVVYYRGNKNPSYSMFHLKKWELENKKVFYSMHEQDEKSIDTSWVTGHHLIFDETFNLVDKVQILPTDTHGELLAEEHEIVVLGEKHYIVIGYDEERYDNSGKIRVVHAIIQEQKNGQVIFEWTSKGKPNFVEMCYEKCPQNCKENADYLHLNAVLIDPKDGHLIVSSASSFSVFKIHRKTGELLWVLGGKKDEFNLSKKDLFIRQHHPQILSDGRLMLFDNGWSSLGNNIDKSSDYDLPNRMARIMFLGLDEQNKKVHVIEKKELGFWAPYMGSVQYLKNENVFVGCGSSNECSARLYDKDMNVLWTLMAEYPYKMYRAYWVRTLN